MQLDVGNEPYLSQQEPLAYVLYYFPLPVSGELAQDYCYGKE